jgi:two-component system cell cycle response regulator
MMDGKDIAILVKSPAVRKFLEDFFRNRKMYLPRHFREAGPFLEHVEGHPPAIVVAEGCLLPEVSDRITRFPSLAMIGGKDLEGELETAIACNAKNYVCRPYLERDLEYKLESLIIEKAAFVKMESEVKELEAIVDLTQLILATLDPKELLHKIVTKVAEIIPVTRCSIIRVDWLRKSAYVVASYENPQVAGIKLSLRKYPEIAEALSSKRPVVVKDVTKDPLMQKVRDILAPLGIRSILVVPIFLRDKVIGTLFLRTSRAEHTFSDHEIRLLNALANASANVLNNAFLFEQVEDEKTRLEKLAITDFLTGIYNVRYFYHRTIEEFSRCLRYSLPISCLMVDIDYFKKINDKYGHKTGDQVLKEFAGLLKRRSRKSDVLARYGGEEFVLLLPQTPLEGAVAEGERILKVVKEHTFRRLRSEKGLTVSVGVAAFPHPKIQSHEDLISLADDALFTAKNRGRERVAVYGE